MVIFLFLCMVWIYSGKRVKHAGFYLLGETKDCAFHIGTAVAKISTIGEGIIVQLTEKWRVLKGNILQCWESNERSKWSSIEKLLWKEGGEFGFYVAVRIWDLFSLYSDKTLLGCVFFSSIQTVYTSVTLNFLVFTSSCLLKRNFFFNFVIWENLRTKPLVFCKTHTLTYVCVNVNISIFTAWLRNKQVQNNIRILRKGFH